MSKTETFHCDGCKNELENAPKEGELKIATLDLAVIGITGAECRIMAEKLDFCSSICVKTWIDEKIQIEEDIPF